MITNPTEIANKLQDHFKSVFTIPTSTVASTTNITTPIITEPLLELSISSDDIINAINEIKLHSACPQGDIPAIVFKQCKRSICFPLMYYWQKSFSKGVVPECFKKQQIIPKHKKGLKSNAKNFRGLSLSPHKIKIIERVLRERFVRYLEVNNILNENQHGFRRKRSCVSQLLSHINFIQECLVNDVQVDTIYLDYAKAFDKIDHKILLEKLKQYHFPKSYITWIDSFLTGRSQFVYLNQATSYSTNVISGVPQGSVLGPLLFIIYINDLPNTISHSRLLTFADDTKVILPIRTSDDTHKLQNDLNSIHTWSGENNMLLNGDKFELICHEKTTKSSNLKVLENLPFSSTFNQYQLSDNTFLFPSTNVRDLGVIINNQLDWEPHILNLCNCARRLSAWILNIFHTRDCDVLMTVFNSLVRSKLEYCCQIWDPTKIKLINKLEKIQQKFTKKLCYMSRHTYWERLKLLRIYSLQRRRERASLTYVWKIKNKLVPNDICLEFTTGCRELRSGEKAIIKPMPRTTGSALSSYEASFVVRAAKLWNSLPSILTEITSLNAFVSKLDKYLKLIPDQPPVDGYYHMTSNSILSYKNVHWKSALG